MELKTDASDLLASRHAEPKSGRRDFLYVAAGAMATVGGAFAIWPFIDNMNPSADVVALSSVEIDISQIEKGQRVTVAWRGSPVFIDFWTEAQIAQARMDDEADLIDPERDDQRVQRTEWLIVVGICTHLGCVPLGQRNGDPLGQWGAGFVRVMVLTTIHLAESAKAQHLRILWSLLTPLSQTKCFELVER